MLGLKLMTDQAPITFSDWYQTGPFAPYVRERKIAGSSAVRMLSAIQPPGDLSDPPTANVVLAVAHKSAFRIQTDYGAGRAVTAARHGTCFLRPPDAAASILAEGTNAFRFFAFSVDHVHALIREPDTSDAGHDFGRLHASGFRSELVERLCDALWEEAAIEDAVGRLFCDQAVLMLFAELHRRVARKPARAKGGLAPRQFRRVSDLMMSRMERGLREPSLVELAEVAGLSANHFCKAFKDTTGSPPHRWIAQRRAEKAKALLRSTDLSLTDIALEIGFGSQTAFGAAFKRMTGETPGVYRRRH